MKIVIDIPKNEFGIEIDDKFQDFFKRLRAEIKAHCINNTSLVCGAYELETIDMFLAVFNDCILLPEHHGKLIDADRLESHDEYDGQGFTKSIYKDDIDSATPIIEGSESE